MIGKPEHDIPALKADDTEDDPFGPLTPPATLLEEIISPHNMLQGFDYVVSHLETPGQRERYRPLRDVIVAKLTREIADGTFRITRADVKDIHVTDGPKERDCQAPSVEKRVGCHCIMTVFERHAYPTLIANTAASIKGRGMHWLQHIVETDIRQCGISPLYYYKCDIRGYYDNISQPLMKADIRRYTREPLLLGMLDSFVELLPRGLSKGLRSSQCFANLHLSAIDHRMSELADSYETGGERRPLYYRYCDDIVMLSGDKRRLWQLRDQLHREVAALGLEIKPDEAVRPLAVGLDYLGYVTYPTHTLLRKRTKQKAARKLARIKSRKRRQEVVGAFKGMAVHCDCKHLYYTLTHHRMKKFSEMGISYVPSDGKKRFPGKVTRLAAIQNKQIEIHDYQDDMTTAHGEGRYLVSFREKQTGEWGKFFTSSDEMKQILDKVSDIEDGYPFETVIESEPFDGNKVKYRFT